MNKLKIYQSLKVIFASAGVILSISACSGEESASIITDSAIESESSSENMESFDYFSSDLSEIESLINEEKIEDAKKKVKDVFVTGVDFIFYDQPIGDVYFDDLTAAGKEMTMDALDTLSGFADQIAPNWKSELSEKYQITSEFVGEEYLAFLDSIREYLGDENYEALGEVKDQVAGDVKEKVQDGKEYLKNWYENFRSNNQYSFSLFFYLFLI